MGLNTARQERARPEDYGIYLQSPEWLWVRNRVLRRDQHCCVLCGSGSRLNVHHRHYKRTGREKMRDLLTLCRSCHERVHAEEIVLPYIGGNRWSSKWRKKFDRNLVRTGVAELLQEAA